MGTYGLRAGKVLAAADRRISQRRSGVAVIHQCGIRLDIKEEVYYLAECCQPVNVWEANEREILPPPRLAGPPQPIAPLSIHPLNARGTLRKTS